MILRGRCRATISSEEGLGIGGSSNVTDLQCAADALQWQTIESHHDAPFPSSSCFPLQLGWQQQGIRLHPDLFSRNRLSSIVRDKLPLLLQFLGLAPGWGSNELGFAGVNTNTAPDGGGGGGTQMAELADPNARSGKLAM